MSGYEAFLAAKDEDDKNAASCLTRQYDKDLNEFSNTFNMHIDQIELGKMTKKDVWEYMLARKNDFIVYLDENQSKDNMVIKEALETAHRQALERWRSIPAPAPETNSAKSAPDLSPENKPTLPPVIQAVLTAGLLDDSPVNGKYNKRGDTKDMNIITWIFNNSGYEDDLTVDLYMQYIHTDCTPQTIGQYISRAKTELKKTSTPT
jgi:hypothetical protein